MKNILLTVLSVCALALLTTSIRSYLQYSELRDEAFAFRQDCGWFTMDVIAVDAETGEPLDRAGLNHDEAYPEDANAQITFPRISQTYDPQPGHTRVSGFAHKPVAFVMSAPNYKEAKFEIVPNRFQAQKCSVVVKLERIEASSANYVASVE